MPDATGSWSQDELDALPQTEAVFQPQTLEVNKHEWRQEGYFIMDVCSPAKLDCHQGGIPIPNESMLVKEDGAYKLIHERTRESV